MKEEERMVRFVDERRVGLWKKVRFVGEGTIICRKEAKCMVSRSRYNKD